MRYLLVHSAREWSGTARVIGAAARGLAERGHHVVVGVEPDSTVERVFSQDAVLPGRSPLFLVEPLSLEGTWMGAAMRLRELARVHGANVVVVHTDREHLVAAVAFRMGSQAYVIRRVPAGRTGVMRRSGRVATRLAQTGFIFANEADQRATVLPRTVARTIAPVGVRMPEVAADTDPEANALHDSLHHAGEYIVCVHDASSRSRAATAIRTIAMLAPRHPSIQLVITGEGGYDDDLRMQAAALDVLHRVTFLGDRADELQVMRGARLGWVVADADTAVYGILDFMALGVPVLAGEGTIAERYVLPHITGVLLPPDDAHTTAATVAGLLTSDAQRARMGEAARLRVAREFPEPAMIDGFEHAASAAVHRRRA